MNKYFIYIIFVILFLLIGCKEKDIIITKDYVINPNWNEKSNLIEITKMKYKNDNDNINLKTAKITEIGNKLEEDTTFVFTANVNFNGEDYSKRKIYFNKDNGFLWWEESNNLDSSKKVLGELQLNTWYILAGLSNIRTLYYIYIDSQGKVHSFERMSSNW
jgi:hypothetical protein